MYLFALTVTLIVTSCGQKKGEDIPLVRPVKTATVSSQSVILKDFSGMVEAVEYVKLAFRVSGQIIDLPVVEGQRVRKGQLIAAIDPRDISLQYAADKAAYETAAAQVERNKRLLGRQAISLQEYEISVANYQKAKSAYELSTNARYETARPLRRLYRKAPGRELSARQFGRRDCAAGKYAETAHKIYRTR